MRRKENRTTSTIIRTICLIIFIIFWESVGNGNVKFSLYMSYPSEIVRDLGMFFESGDLIKHLSETMKEAYSGLFIGTSLGVLLGLLLSQIELLGKVLVPLMHAFQTIPQVTLTPLYILWFGIAFKSKVILTTIMVFLTVFFSTYNGIKNIDQGIIEAATILGASPFKILFTIVMPTAMPSILSGFRSAARTCVVGAIIGEYVGSSRGIGWMIMYASSYFKISRVFSCIIILMTLGVTVDWLISKIEDKVLVWKPRVKLNIQN